MKHLFLQELILDLDHLIQVTSIIKYKVEVK